MENHRTISDPEDKKILDLKYQVKPQWKETIGETLSCNNLGEEQEEEEYQEKKAETK